MRHSLKVRRGDDGMIAGVEGIIIGVAVFMFGALLITELWTVLDARSAVDDAARNAVRVYVEAPNAADARQRAAAEASATMNGHARTGSTTTILTALPFGRCVRVEIKVTAQVPQLTMAGIGGAGTYTVVGRHSELVDPYRSGLEGVPHCAP